MTLVDVLFASPIFGRNGSENTEPLNVSEETNAFTAPVDGDEEYGNRENIESTKEVLYGASQSNDTGYQPPSLGTLTVGLLIAISVICFCVIVPMGKAFNCGATKAALGMTGTAWGVILLFVFLFFPWIAILLGIVFVLSNKCDQNRAMQISGLLSSPQIAYVPEPFSMSSTPTSFA